MNLRASCAVLVPLVLASVACAGRRVAPPPPPVVRTPAAVPAPPPPVALAPSVPTTTPPAALPWTAATPVGRIVAERPSTARVLERAGVDYCCGGATPLGEAARAKGRDVDALLVELAAARATPAPANDRVWTDAPMKELLGHIEATHHVYLREELPRLAPIVEKVRGVHGVRHPALTEVASLYAALARDLPPHLELEERRLFPALEALADGRPAPAADVLPALALMQSQHDGAGAALHRLHELTNGYAVPADACASYREMLTGLAALEADLHTHVHLENNVVAPRVEALARK